VADAAMTLAGDLFGQHGSGTAFGQGYDQGYQQGFDRALEDDQGRDQAGQENYADSRFDPDDGQQPVDDPQQDGLDQQDFFDTSGGMGSDQDW
jgi:hypothetical protein